MIQFKIDENLPVELADLLREAGHDAHTVLEEELGGTEDLALIHTCNLERRVLVTFDVGFSDIRTYPPEKHSGILLLRINRQDKPAVLRLMERLIPLFKDREMSGRLWIADGERVRVREA